MAFKTPGRYRPPTADVVHSLHLAFTRQPDTVYVVEGHAYIHYSQFHDAVVDFVGNLNVGEVLGTRRLGRGWRPLRKKAAFQTSG